MLNFLSNLLSPPGSVTRVVCFHFGRCGSTLLGNMLASHPHLDWRGEVFHAHHERADREATIAPFAKLKEMMGRSKSRHFGFETKFQHLNVHGLNIDLESYIEHLQQLGFNKFVVLSRRNYLRQAISVARGQATGKWHVATSTQKPAFSPIELDIERIALGGKNRSIVDCFEFLDRSYEEAFQLFRRLELDWLQLVYEDDLERDPMVGHARALSHFQIPFVGTEVSVQKLETRSVAEIVANYAQICRCLQGTHYRWMCER